MSSPKYQKRHYIEQARILRASNLSASALEAEIKRYGNVYSDDNPQFDWSRWEAAVRDGLIQARHDTKQRPMSVSDGDRKLAHERIFGPQEVNKIITAMAPALSEAYATSSDDAVQHEDECPGCAQCD